MKQWYLSKTVWVNLIALIGVALETTTGKEIIDPAAQGVILTVINLVLRFVTKQGITFKTIEGIIKPDAAAPIEPIEAPVGIIPTEIETPQAAPAAAPTQPDPAQVQQTTDPSGTTAAK
jgi:hypothetical protein